MRSPQLASIFSEDRSARALPLKSYEAVSQKALSSASLLADPEYKFQEGRGLYIPVDEFPGRYFYIKGAGNSQSLSSATEGTDWRRFKAIGHRDLSEYFFDKLSGEPYILDGSCRVKGALLLKQAIKEFVVAQVIHDSLRAKHGLSTLEDARKNGISIPALVVDCPEISQEINAVIERLQQIRYPGSRKKNKEPIKYGMVIIEVPANERIRKREDIGKSKAEFFQQVLSDREKMQAVGRTLAGQLGTGFVTISTHYQNIYDAPRSLCPQADNSDLVPISEILRITQNPEFVELILGKNSNSQENMLISLVMKQLEFAPFNLLRFNDEKIQNLAAAAIYTILDTFSAGKLDSGEILSVCASFRKKPYSTLRGLAEKIVSLNLAETNPMTDWQKTCARFKSYGLDRLIVDQAIKAIQAAHDLEINLAKLEYRK